MLTNGNWSLIAWNAVALFVYMTLVFAVAYRRKKLNTVDAAWGGAFVVSATMMAGIAPNIRTIVITILVDLWAVRLTIHLMERIRSQKEDDPRYVELARKWKGDYWPRAYFSVFLLQGLLALIISLPAVFATGESTSWSTLLLVVGGVVWLGGFIVEAVADNQLRQFLTNKNNHGKVMDKGLWRTTRHPNYFGELTQWYGIGIIACGAVWGWAGLIGPLVLTVLIRFISGVPPIENRKKHDKDYADYMKRTNAILPRLNRG